MNTPPHFLKLADRSPQQYRALFDRTRELNERRRRHLVDATLTGRTLGMMFEKASTRTRLSFEAAISQLGGHAVVLPYSESQLARGEPLTDTARVVSSYVDAIVMRTFGEARLHAFVDAATVPVINGLTDEGHPIQLVADLFTIEEKLGGVQGKKVAFIGDGCSNMARSFIEAARLFDFELRLARPSAFKPPREEAEAAHAHLQETESPAEAVQGADVIVTDVWTSMGQEAETARRNQAFNGFCVDGALLRLASPRAIVMHCLPAHRGEEISAEVIDGSQSVVFEEAENRLHVQKALLEQILFYGS